MSIARGELGVAKVREDLNQITAAGALMRAQHARDFS